MSRRIRGKSRRQLHLYITEWREHFHLTLEQLGDRAGVGRNTVWRWENEQHRLNPEKLALIAHHLNIAPAALFGPPPPHPYIPPTPPPPPDDLDLRIERAIRRVNKRG